MVRTAKDDSKQYWCRDADLKRNRFRVFLIAAQTSVPRRRGAIIYTGYEFV